MWNNCPIFVSTIIEIYLEQIIVDIATSIEIMKSLADASRLRVLNALLQKPQYVEELANRLELAVSTVSFHLKKLEGAGLVTKTKEQYYTVFYPSDEIFNMTLREMVSFENLESFIQEERMKSYRQKVLRTFMKNNKIEKLPVQHKKKMIILDEFLKRMDPGKKYTEKEINELILESYEDYCTVRRLMIEEGMMKRKNQTYWLNEDYEKGKSND